MLYATRHPDRVDRLVLITPSPFAVGIAVTPPARREIVRTRRHHPWLDDGTWFTRPRPRSSTLPIPRPD